MTNEQIKEKAKDFVSKIAGGTSKEMDYYANILAEFATEVTKELEKENAELKAFRQDCVKLTEDNVVIVRQRAETSKQLTNAKEIIGELFHYIPSWTGKENDKPRVYAMPDELRAKAEQFLKDCEVEK